MNKLDTLISLADDFPPHPREDPETAADVAADAYEVLGELFSTIARYSHDCGVTADELAQAITSGTGIRTIKPGIDIPDIVGEILSGGDNPHYKRSATRLDRILRSHIH